MATPTKAKGTTTKREAPADDELRLAENRELIGALKKTFEYIDEYISNAHKRAEQARRGGLDELADFHEGRAARYVKLTTAEFRHAAWRLIRTVSFAAGTGDTDDVLWLAKHVDKRKRREWLRTCQRSQHLLPDLGSPTLAKEHRRDTISELPHLLAWVDERAESLTSEQVASALNGKATTVEGLAARLACDCGAFDYGPDDYQRAVKAFRNLPSDE